MNVNYAPTQLSTLLIGDHARADFQPAVASLQRDTRLTCVATVEAACHAPAGERHAWDFIILAQSRPGQFAPADARRLRQMHPLATLVRLLGSWCEGEMRTEAPWPGAARVYWYDWEARFGQSLAALRQRRCDAWGLPTTTTDAERLLVSAYEVGRPQHGLIALDCRTLETADALADACRGAGFSTVWLRRDRPTVVHGVAAAIWDGAQFDAAEADELATLSRRIEWAPIVALLDYPRHQAVPQAQKAGAHAVLGKPYATDDLLWHLGRCIAKRPAAVPTVA